MKDTAKLLLVDTSLKTKKLSLENKIKLAKQLEKFNVDVVELPVDEKDLASALVSDIKEITLAISCLPRQDKLNEAWNLIKDANKSRLRLLLAPELLKDINLNNVQDKNDVIKLVKDSVVFAKKLTENIEFVIINFEDIHKMFLYRIIEEAAEAGARIVTVVDSNSNFISSETGDLFGRILFNLPDFDELIIGSANNNKLGLSTANSLAAIYNGARQVDVSVINCSCTTSTTPLKDLLKAIETRKDIFKITTSLNFEEFNNTFELVESIYN